MKIFYEDPFLKISYLDSINTERCIVAFTGIGHALGGIDIQREEFFSLHKIGMVIWITDKRRSWGNNFNIEKISDLIIKISKKKEIFVIGNSMGGFLGILFSKFLGAKKVLSFVPQFSVHPNIASFDNRWLNYTKNISNFRYKDLSNSFDDNIKYSVLLGDGKEEEAHYRLFANFSHYPNVELIKLTGIQHNVAHYLKNLNLLNECINKFFSDKSLKNFFSENSIKFK